MKLENIFRFLSVIMGSSEEEKKTHAITAKKISKTAELSFVVFPARFVDLDIRFNAQSPILVFNHALDHEFGVFRFSCSGMSVPKMNFHLLCVRSQKNRRLNTLFNI